MDLNLDPLDFQNFLLINPPLTEYSDYAILNDPNSSPNTSSQLNPRHFLPQQPPHAPQRRLSISNGQIGQISMMVHSNHQLTNPTNSPGTSSNSLKQGYAGDDSIILPNGIHGGGVGANGVIANGFATSAGHPINELQLLPNGMSDISNQIASVMASTDNRVKNNGNGTNNNLNGQHINGHHLNGQHINSQHISGQPLNGHQTLQVPATANVLQQIPPPLTPDEPRLSMDYNGSFNTVQNPPVYAINKNTTANERAGPPPGSLAWKKQRILERNRVAASKCRMKKKTQQKKLAEELEDLRRMRDEESKIRKLVKSKVSKWAKKRDPTLNSYTESMIMEMIFLEERSENDHLLKSWMR